MKTYTIFIHDRRYSAPTFLAADFDRPEDARSYASTRLQGSRFYTGIEVWDEDEMVCDLRVSDQPSSSA